MNFKLIHIRYKFLIQIFLFIVYLIIVLGVILSVNKRLMVHQKTSQHIDNIEKSLRQVQTSYFNFLRQTKANDRFYRDGENDLSLLFTQNIAATKDSLSHITEIKRINRKFSESGWMDSLALSLNSHAAKFEQTKLAIKEIGVRNSGKTLSLRKSSDQLIASIRDFDNPELNALSAQLKNLESEYLFASNKLAYNDIIYLIDDLPYHPVLAELDYMLIDGLSSNIAEYKTKLHQVNAIFSRIGSIDNLNSLLGEMESSFQEVIIVYRNMGKYGLTLVTQGIRALVILGIILIIFFSLIYTLSLYLFYKQFNIPLTKSILYSHNIANGKLNENSISTEFSFEFASLNTNLNTINSSLMEKKNFVDDLLEQKFQTDLSLQGKNDTFGKTLIALKENMQKARDEQLNYHQENRVRRYQNEGIARFSDILRSNSDNLEKLADIFIKEIVRYLEALQGGLFLLENENDDTLHLKAAFAYNRKKYLSKEIKKGESLIGTCALEKKTINLTGIPENYIEITSGLGDAPPNNLLILPIMHEEVLIGVLELASLNKFDDNQVLLGETLSESLASSILNARVNSKTAELLEKSQQQAAEMAEQEEEMRQNMEELKATQEESARREEDLEGVLNAIDQTFYVIEYDIDGTITKVNERLLYLLNKHADKVLGKTHVQLFGKTSKADMLLFANVAEGNTVELIEKVEINKKHFEIKNSFSPIKSGEGTTLRILNIMNLNT